MDDILPYVIDDMKKLVPNIDWFGWEKLELEGTMLDENWGA